MSSSRVGALIGAGFGAGYVFANAGTLPSIIAWGLRLLAIAALAGSVIWSRRMDQGGKQGDAERGGPPGFGPSFGWVVLAEALVIFVGAYFLRGPLHLPQAVLPWLTLVVGLHFFGFARLWRTTFFSYLGAALTCCGIVAGGLALGHASLAAIRAAGGVLPGLILLASSYYRPQPDARHVLGKAADKV